MRRSFWGWAIWLCLVGAVAALLILHASRGRESDHSGTRMETGLLDYRYAD